MAGTGLSLQMKSLVAADAGAEKAGYGAIMVTVDSPRVGNRELDERNK